MQPGDLLLIAKRKPLVFHRLRMLLIPAVALCLSTPISAQERIVGGPYEVIGERGIILHVAIRSPPILRAGAHTVTDTFECAAGHNFSELLEERRLSGDE